MTHQQTNFKATASHCCKLSICCALNPGVKWSNRHFIQTVLWPNTNFQLHSIRLRRNFCGFIASRNFLCLIKLISFSFFSVVYLIVFRSHWKAFFSRFMPQFVVSKKSKESNFNKKQRNCEVIQYKMPAFKAKSRKTRNTHNFYDIVILFSHLPVMECC